MQVETQLIPLSFEKVMQAKTYTLIVLASGEKKFAIYAEPAAGKVMQMHLMGVSKPRPHTHDLLQMIFQGFDIRVKHIVINELNDTIYQARLFLEQKLDGATNIVEIDVRPSDAIMLALVHRAAIYCTEDVLEKTVEYKD